jgi:hypothetical protein
MEEYAMSRNLSFFFLLAIAFVLCLGIVGLKSSGNSVAAFSDPSTFKQALLQYKGKNIEIESINNAGKYKVKLSDIKDDYIITELSSGSSDSTIAYTPFLSIHSFKKFSDGTIIVYMR